MKKDRKAFSKITYLLGVRGHTAKRHFSVDIPYQKGRHQNLRGCLQINIGICFNGGGDSAKNYNGFRFVCHADLVCTKICDINIGCILDAYVMAMDSSYFC